MADNVTLQASELASAAAGEVFGFDDVGGVKIARSKTGWGADGVYVDASAANPLPVVQTGTPALPTGAATAAKQPALGTAGSASADVLTVQGIMSMTPLKVDGSAVTQPVSASALPLPSGASSLAEQQTQTTAIGATNETAASSDTATAGLNGRLQRIAQRLTSLIALLPSSIGQKAATGSLSVVLASDQGAIPTPSVSSATPANVSDSTTSQTLAASNLSRKGLIIANDSAATLYVKYGATASLTSFTVAIPGYGTGVMQSPIYTGQVDGIWSADTSSGAARVTEL